jgi:hypothetical protein
MIPELFPELFSELLKEKDTRISVKNMFRKDGANSSHA